MRTVDRAKSDLKLSNANPARVGATHDRRLLLRDVERRRFEGPDLVPLMHRALQRWDPPAVWVERTGFQLSIIQEARRAGPPVREAAPKGDKVSRAMPLTAALEGGRLLLPASAPWLSAQASYHGGSDGPHCRALAALAAI